MSALLFEVITLRIIRAPISRPGRVQEWRDWLFKREGCD
jgi:hypothetical protein